MFADQGLSHVFGADGPLADSLPGYSPRPEQLAMAEDVAAALAGQHNLVIEAGTGTGKTFAYLLPVLDSGRRVVISTGTKTLQDQLFHRDLPTIGKAIGRPADAQLLKGRSNYLCLYRFDRVQSDTNDAGSAGRRRDLSHVREWARQTRTGDIAEVADVAEDSPVWSRVTSTNENCLGSKCPVFDDCHVVAARQAAREAEIVVVNHHLLLADLTMKDEGFGQLLPGADAIVVDEAHHFPDVAQSFFNTSLGSGQLADLVNDARAEAVRAGVLETDFERALDNLDRAAKDARIPLGDGMTNLPWSEAATGFESAFDALGDALMDLGRQLEDLGGVGHGLDRCRQRAGTLHQAWSLICDADEEDGLRWLRTTARTFTANVTPLDTSAELSALLEAQPNGAWIFTSATLAVQQDFSHFLQKLGVDNIRTRQIPSPFPFAEIARLYLPRELPAPNSPDYTDAAVEQMRAAVRLSNGRAFLLFTSHRALRRAAELLEQDDDFTYPLLVQGTEPRSRLLEQFSRRPNAVLLGTSTFWEGVDIRGPDLVLVAIDRLPFASPGDPMLSARLEAIRNRGGNPFMEYQLPQAVLSLKQGVGRLIRDPTDYGVVMICDPRVKQKSYGRVFLSSLPGMPVVRDLAAVEQFFAGHIESVA